MFWNNLKIALRNLRKNKLFAFINIAGLALGMTIYVLGGLIVKYEKNHDAFFANSDRIYTVGSIAAPELNVGIDQLNATFSAVGPIIESELTDVEVVARTLRREFLVTQGDNSFYQTILFSDPALLEIFDFDYVGGSADALNDPSSILITETTAIKYFGDTDVVGKVITLDNQHDFYISAVIENVPQNSHFNSSMVLEGQLEILAPIKALGPLRDFDEAGEWNNLSLGNMTYVMLPAGLDGTWLQTQMDGIYDRLLPEDQHEVITAFLIEPLQHANLAFWDTIGMPVITVIQLLSFLVLLIACVNYTNLATAQSLGRSREVGMRKTMGAGQHQLLSQFLLESLVIAAISMVVAIAILEVVIPLLNNASNKAMTLDYTRTLPWLVLTTVLVGLCSGLYPAWLITRASPIAALRDEARKGKKGARMRSVMIGVQFAISAFMLSTVAISYMQNQRVKEASYIFPKSEIYTLARLGIDDIRGRLDTLRNELEALPDVESVAFSSQVPFEQSNSQTGVAAKPGDEAGAVTLMMMRMTPEFLDTYNIPLVAGRNLSRDMANDEFLSDETEVLNVLVNEMALGQLGIASPQEAINQRFYDLDVEDTLREYVIVGVVPTQNILGLFNAEKPWVFFYSARSLRTGSVRIRAGADFMDTVGAVEDVWKRVIPDYPMQGRFLDDVFNDVYKVLKYMNMALGGFAFVALSLAMVGLFGLAAFMAAQRTKEIGVRKVLGASSTQIARLLVWQFSKPVMWALAVALPAAFFASNSYLDFFAERIESPIMILLGTGLISVLLAWSTVAGHAYRIARANPVLALHYE
jgi:putative ABC transport system permease protein